MQRIRHAAAAVALVGALSACSVYTDMTTSDFAKQDADAIVAAAGKAMQAVSSVRLTGQVRSRGNQVFVDLHVDRDHRCAGSIRLGGSTLDIRRVQDRAWVRGEPAAFARLSSTRLPAAALTKLGSSWLPVDDKDVVDLCDLDSLLAGFEVVDYGTGQGGDGPGKGGGRGAGKDLTDGAVPATVGEESTVDGETVVALSGTPGGQHEELFWVRSEAPHYVVRIESTAARDGAALALTEFDQDVAVEAPAPADVLRP